MDREGRRPAIAQRSAKVAAFLEQSLGCRNVTLNNSQVAGCPQRSSSSRRRPHPAAEKLIDPAPPLAQTATSLPVQPQLPDEFHPSTSWPGPGKPLTKTLPRVPLFRTKRMEPRTR